MQDFHNSFQSKAQELDFQTTLVGKNYWNETALEFSVLPGEVDSKEENSSPIDCSIDLDYYVSAKLGSKAHPGEFFGVDPLPQAHRYYRKFHSWISFL